VGYIHVALPVEQGHSVPMKVFFSSAGGLLPSGGINSIEKPSLTGDLPLSPLLRGSFVASSPS